jgi:hypothetical protein
MVRVPAAALAAALLATPAASQGEAPPGAADREIFKRAGNFIEYCDARPDESGERPPENYLCLSFVDGLIQGYTYGAAAATGEQPYCLPRPVALFELMDMMVTVIERGVPEDMPTAAVFHFLVTTNFPCERAPEARDGTGAAPAADAPDTAGEDAN